MPYIRASATPASGERSSHLAHRESEVHFFLSCLELEIGFFSGFTLAVALRTRWVTPPDLKPRGLDRSCPLTLMDPQSLWPDYLRKSRVSPGPHFPKISEFGDFFQFSAIGVSPLFLRVSPLRVSPLGSRDPLFCDFFD